ncbi:hypothetical protein DSM112329_04804 [Paraconexibacter sp. AEG42_29]|uniref:Glycosyl transferase n=1 Tax=Paraconexibacter sp. AEG42_29 TaxID=2997339 RepID=A0AAU7B224_9ACTN
MHTTLQVADVLLLVYFVVLDLVYGSMAVIGWTAVNGYVKRRPLRDYSRVARSSLSPAITILVPAHGEELTIAGSVRGLLLSHYPALEIVVVNDGSTDGTLAALQAEFHLHPIKRVPSAAVECAPIRGLYASASTPNLTVIDKENGGKADALNAGLRYCRTPLFCTIDADTILDANALSRIVWEFEVNPDTVAAGGIVRVLNGSTVCGGQVQDVVTSRNYLANLQILEYLRAFLGGRIAWSRLGMLLIISGAFGLFDRRAVVEAGGYDTGTVGEDAELVLRLHRHRREQGRDCHIVFFPDPICWTEAPTTLRVLRRQRDRWQRGLLEMLWKHRGMILRPRYGAVGTVAMPYFIVFEAFGPLIEVSGYVLFGVSVGVGAVSWSTALFFLMLAVAFGFALSYMTLLIEERAFQRYPSWRCLGRLILTSLLENLGYRQWLALVRTRAWWTQLRGGAGWGEMQRRGLTAETLPRGPAPDQPAASG